MFILFYLFSSCLIFVKTTARPQSGQLRISSRLEGGFGKAAKLELVNGQRFGWIGHLLAHSCWRTWLWKGICWQESGESCCFSHAHLFSHENKSIHYWLFIILPSNKLAARQAASGSCSMLPGAARPTSGVADNEWANQTSFPKMPSENYSAQQIFSNSRNICRNWAWLRWAYKQKTWICSDRLR